MEKEKEYKFTYAWCEKEQDLLTPLDVRDIWRQGDIEPLLQCPDEQCRKDNPGSRIIPVCCNPDAPCKKMQPYFRTGPEHPHSDSCGYAELAEATRYVMTHKNIFIDDNKEANLLRELEGVPDTSLLADEYLTIYDPQKELSEIAREAQRQRRLGKSKREALNWARASVPQKTCSLKKIVEMCELLDATKERPLVPLALPGRTSATYLSAFFRLPKLQEDFRTSYIFYGRAIIEKMKHGYLVKYCDPLRKYHPDYPDIRAITLIDSSVCKKRILQTLEEFSVTGETCCVYTFSDHRLNESTCPVSEMRSCVVITPKASDAVVIRKTCVKQL